MEQQSFAIGKAEFPTHRLTGTGWWARREEVVDHIERAADRQQAAGLAFQETGNRRNGVGLLQRMTDGGAVAGIAAEQGSVRAVESGDHTRRERRREHRAGEDGRRGVWHGVVNVQNVQVVFPTNFRHLDGEG